MIGAALGWLAVGALAFGSVPMAQPSGTRTITASNCGGGTVTITLDQEPGEEIPACPKGACHAGLCRAPKPISDEGNKDL